MVEESASIIKRVGEYVDTSVVVGSALHPLMDRYINNEFFYIFLLDFYPKSIVFSYHFIGKAPFY